MKTVMKKGKYKIVAESWEERFILLFVTISTPFHVMTCSYCKRPGFWKAFKFFVLHKPIHCDKEQEK
jgi:hypothetical protein